MSLSLILDKKKKVKHRIKENNYCF